MPEDRVLASLLLAFADFAEPLLDAFASPEAMEYEWYRHGWRVTLDEAALTQLEQVLPIAADARDLAQLAGAVRARQEVDPAAGPSVAELEQLAAAAARLAEALPALMPSDLAGLPGPLADPSTWEDLGDQLLDTLLERYLATYHPIGALVLLIGGILRYEPLPAAPPARVAGVRAVFDWGELGPLLRDPVAALARTYRWNDPALTFDHERLLDALGRVLRSLGVETRVLNPAFQLEPGLPAAAAATVIRGVDGLRATLLRGVALDGRGTYEVGFDLLPAGAAGAVPSGLLLRPRLKGAATETFPLGGSFTLGVTVDASIGDLFAILFLPGETSVAGVGGALGTALTVAAAGEEPWYLVGNPGAARIEVVRPELQAAVEGTVADAELRLRLATAGHAGARVVIPMGRADAFVRSAVAGDELRFTFSPEVIWSSATGFAFNGGTTPQLSLPLSIKVGAFTLSNASIGVTDEVRPDGKTAFGLRVATDVAGRLGPVAAIVQGIGFVAEIVPYTRAELRALPPGADRPALGNVDVDLRFKTPDGIGLRLEAGVVRGGGFLRFDPAHDEYAGALELQFGRIGIKAFGLIAGGADGWSLLMLLYGQFPPIQLAFGFTLNKIGGLIGVQHAIDIPALAAGMRDGAFDDILFPADAITDAPRIIARLKFLFPHRPGALTIGPMVELGYGRPRQIAFVRMAVAMQLDGAVGSGSVAFAKVVLVGNLRIAISPKDDEPETTVVKLIVDFFGFWELDRKRYGFLAALRDSRIGPVDVIGGLAVWGEYGEHPRFLLAAGGFNPRFKDVPAEMSGALDRLGAAFTIGRFHLTLKGYFALTPGTIQVGLDLTASANVGSVGLNGTIGFDALIYREPYTHFIADFRVTVEVSYRGRSLAGVRVTGTIEGPGLWHLVGEMSFSILWWDISKSFDETWGRRPELATDATDVGALIAAALADAANWSAQLPQGSEAMVTLAPPADEPAALAHPLGRFVVSQRVAPLGVRLDRYGSGPVTGGDRFDVTAVSIGGPAEHDPVTEHFARAEFVEVTEEEKYARPAFEALEAGVAFASDTYHVPAGATTGSLDYERTAYLDIDPRGGGRTRPALGLGLVAVDATTIGVFTAGGAAGRAPQRHAERMRARDALRIAIAPSPPLAAADPKDMTAATGVRLDGPGRFADLIAGQQFERSDPAHVQLVEEFEVI